MLKLTLSLCRSENEVSIQQKIFCCATMTIAKQILQSLGWMLVIAQTAVAGLLLHYGFMQSFRVLPFHLRTHCVMAQHFTMVATVKYIGITC